MKKINTSFWIGDEVVIGGKISAKIAAIIVEGTGVEYKCSYMYEGSFQTAWLNDFEIQCKNANLAEIGFAGREG